MKETIIVKKYIGVILADSYFLTIQFRKHKFLRPSAARPIQLGKARASQSRNFVLAGLMAENTKSACSQSPCLLLSGGCSHLHLLIARSHQIFRGLKQQVRAMELGTLQNVFIIILPVEHQYPLLLFHPLLAGVAVPIPLGHLSFRRTKAVEVIALIAAVTQDDLVIVRVTQADTAEARWTVPALAANLHITCNLLGTQATDVIVFIQTTRVVTDQEPLVHLFRSSAHLAADHESSMGQLQLRKFRGGHTSDPYKSNNIITLSNTNKYSIIKCKKSIPTENYRKLKKHMVSNICSIIYLTKLNMKIDQRFHQRTQNALMEQYQNMDKNNTCKRSS